ncbi:MAG: SURF1 family protein, partial [Propionicimonas sp.]|nr:SURF1 family protein [Propionicimonas sp.]
MGVAPAGRRLWPRWIALAVFVVALVVAFVNLGYWQLDRLEQRRERNDAVVAHETAPVLAWDEVYGPVITEADQWQRVRVTGSFDGEHQFVVRYRTNAGQSGYEVLTPLRTADGRYLLVDRGFGARPSGEDFPTVAPPAPTGEVTIVGHVRRNEQGPEQATNPDDGQVRLVNSVAIAAALPYPLLDGYLGVLEISSVQDGGLVPVQPPELTEGNHLSYAVQWFMFSALAGVGLVLLIRSDLKAQRKQSTRKESE